MLLENIIKHVNKIIANNSSFKLNYDQLEFYINTAVDYINTVLKTQMLNPQEQWENNLLLNNILYNESIKSTHMYLGEYDKHPIDANGAIYYNTTDNLLYYCNEDTWELLDIDNGKPDIKDLIIKKVPLYFDYNALPDNIIRMVLIYYVAASYLEEEDEFESQYKTYLNKAEDNLLSIRSIYYSMYDLNDYNKHHHHKYENKNPYGLPEGDD